jgi:hypothetical protein
LHLGIQRAGLRGRHVFGHLVLQLFQRLDIKGQLRLPMPLVNVFQSRFHQGPLACIEIKIVIQVPVRRQR